MCKPIEFVVVNSDLAVHLRSFVSWDGIGFTSLLDIACEIEWDTEFMTGRDELFCRPSSTPCCAWSSPGGHHVVAQLVQCRSEGTTSTYPHDTRTTQRKRIEMPIGSVIRSQLAYLE